MPAVRETLGGYDFPLIWTTDFILDKDEAGEDAYRIGEINSSCVGEFRSSDINGPGPGLTNPTFVNPAFVLTNPASQKSLKEMFQNIRVDC